MGEPLTWMRLRQVAIVVFDLESTVETLGDALGLKVAFRDPSVGAFGLRNAVLPVGSQFVEVLSPTRAGTAAGRQMDRAGGEAGYMVIMHTDEHAAARSRVRDMGVRIAFEADHGGFQIMQLHPSDTAGSFLEVDYQPGGDDPEGPWTPAGPDWQSQVDRSKVDAISALTVSSTNPGATCRRWAEILGVPSNSLSLKVENATVNFEQGEREELVEVLLRPSGAERPATLTFGSVRFS
ncbi:MAG: VOC family protein [Acidimicrobiales bacterium]